MRERGAEFFVPGKKPERLLFRGVARGVVELVQTAVEGLSPFAQLTAIRGGALLLRNGIEFFANLALAFIKPLDQGFTPMFRAIAFTRGCRLHAVRA